MSFTKRMCQSKKIGCRRLFLDVTRPPRMARSFQSLASFCVSKPMTGVYGSPERAIRIGLILKPSGRLVMALKLKLFRTSKFEYAASAARLKGFKAETSVNGPRLELSSRARARV